MNPSTGRRQATKPETRSSTLSTLRAKQVESADAAQLTRRLKKVRGQLDAVERALAEGRDCGDQLMLLAAVRGGVNALMGAVLETHIRVHMTEDAKQRIAPDLAEDLLQLVRTYLK